VWRKNTTKDLAVTVAELKEDADAPQRQRQGGPTKEKARPNRMGLALVDLTDDQKKELDLKGGIGVGVDAVSGAVRANVQAGDVILAVISRGVTTEAKSAAQLNEIFSKLDKSTPVTLQVRRGDNQFYATLRPLPPDSE